MRQSSPPNLTTPVAAEAQMNPPESSQTDHACRTDMSKMVLVEFHSTARTPPWAGSSSAMSAKRRRIEVDMG